MLIVYTMKQFMSESNQSIFILNTEDIGRAVRRLAHEIVERNPDLTKLCLVGIPSRGVELARRLARHIGESEGAAPEVGILDISMHRDDLAMRREPPLLQNTELPGEINGRHVVLIDDVIFTGRTCRAALEALSSFGRPARIQLAVLIDRGHRELPISPDYVGKNLPTARTERVMVRLQNVDDEPDSVRLRKPEASQ